MKDKTFSDEQIIAALNACDGFVSRAAKKLGCTRDVIRWRLEKSEAVRDALDAIEDSRLDEAEDQLMSAIRQGQPWAVKFMLAYKGRKRGYSQTAALELRKSPAENAALISDERLEKLLEENRRKALSPPNVIDVTAEAECQSSIDIKQEG